MLYLNEASCYVPETYLEVEQAGELLKLDRAQVKVYRKMYGIEKIPVAMRVHPVELIRRTVEDLISKSNVNKKDIKYLIHCHTAKVMTPFGTSIVRTIKKDLGLTHVFSFGSSMNNCASVMVALEVLSHILKDEKAILVCGDYGFTRVMQLIPNTSILGDAAAAILVSKQGDKNKLLSISIETAGEYARGIWLTAEESREFENRYADLLAKTIMCALDKVGLNLQQLKMIIPHNVNLPSWRRVAASLKFPIDKIYLKNIKKYSHCFGADIFINYLSAESENFFQKGDFYLMATVGLGATFAAAVFQY